MSNMLKVFTLDRLIIELNGEIISKFVSQKAPALFVYLVSHPREHQRDILAELFWSDTTSKQALKNLRTILSNLQKVGLGDFLDVTRQTLSIINMDAIWVDYIAFEAMLNEVVARQKSPYSPRRLFNEMKLAVELYEGDFLVGLKTGNAIELDTWATLERERLRGRVTNAIFDMLDLALENGDYASGIQYGNRLMSLEPLWEDAVRRLMTLQAYNGNRNAAVQQYDSFAKTLQKELEIPPEDETTALYRAIKTGRIKAVPPQPKPNNLQKPSNTYVENPEFVQQIHEYLDVPNTRLLTLLGQGGIGKTHLAEYIAYQRLEDYRDGVFFVPLASVTTPDFVPQAILNALNISQIDTRRTPKDALLENLRDKHMLIALDNMEHLLESVDLIQSILGFCPHVQLLVTSREQLQIQGESILAVPVLPYPADDAVDTMGFPSVRLFGQIAQLVQPDFSVSACAEDVARVCRLVDGLPLAIVIAAGWVQFLPVNTIANRIAENIDFLTISRRDLPERHRGITALMNSTWASLVDQERRVMQKLTVFKGDFSLEAAESVAEASLPDLMALVSKSLLQTARAGRYQQHELLRRYAQERAVGSRVIKQAQQALTHYFRQWAHDLHASNLPSHERFTAIDAEYHNLWTIDHLPEEQQYQHILDLANIMQDYWMARGFPLSEHVEVLENALPFASDDVQRVTAVIRLANLYIETANLESAQDILLHHLDLIQEVGNLELQANALNAIVKANAFQGEFEGAIDYSAQLIALCENAPNSEDNWRFRLLAIANMNLGIVYSQIGDDQQSEQYAFNGLKFAQQIGDMVNLALCHNLLGIIDLDRENFASAHSHFSEALGIAQDIEHTRFQTIFAGNLAEVVHKQGDYTFAYRIYNETLQAAYRINNQRTILNVCEQLASLLGLYLHMPQEATVILGVAQSIRDDLNILVEPRQQEDFDKLTISLQQAIGTTAFDTALHQGKSMPLHTILDYLSEITPHKIKDL